MDTYEKKYNEALEIARNLYPGVHSHNKAMLEQIFPELRESEDERIRRIITDGVFYQYGAGAEYKDVLDYLDKLEKQKVNTEGDFGRGYDCGYQAGYSVAMNEMKPKVATATLNSEQQKEQKPVEWSEEDNKMLADTLNSLKRYQLSMPNYQVELQMRWLKSLRPSWKPSEDEERLINTAISFLKDFADKGYENAVECIDWLKSKLNGNSNK